MPKNQPLQKVNLNDIKLFVSVVQAGNITKASELLNLPKSYLSRHLTDLENAIGTTLMDRSRRGIVLNELGSRFYQNALEMIRLAQYSVDDISECLNQPNGLLKISVSTEIGRGVLMHYLPEFLRLYPNVNLEVQIDNRKVNMIQDGIDIALRTGNTDNDNVIAKKLMDVEFGLFASKNYLNIHGIPTIPHDLYQHSLIYKYDGPIWQFTQSDKSIEIMNHARFMCNDFNLAGQMVADNIGIALLPLFNNLIRDDFVRLLKDWHIKSTPLHIIYYKNRGATAIVRSFVDFLSSRLV